MITILINRNSMKTSNKRNKVYISSNNNFMI